MYSHLQVACLQRISLQLFNSCIRISPNISCCDCRNLIHQTIDKLCDQDGKSTGQVSILNSMSEYRTALSLFLVDELTRRNFLFHQCKSNVWLEQELREKKNKYLNDLYQKIVSKRKQREINLSRTAFKCVFQSLLCYPSIIASSYFFPLQQFLTFTCIRIDNLLLDKEHELYKGVHESLLQVATSNDPLQMPCLHYALMTYKQPFY
jgi:hypothetical protein